MRHKDELKIEEQSVPSHFKVEDGVLYLWSTVRQKWYRAIKAVLIANYGDVEVAQWTEKGDIISIPRLKGEKSNTARFKSGKVMKMERPPDRLWYPKGDLVIFEFEDGVTVYMDSGDDPTGSTHEFVKRLVEAGLINFRPEDRAKKMTNLQDIFENDESKNNKIDSSKG